MFHVEPELGYQKQEEKECNEMNARKETFETEIITFEGF